LQHLLQSQGELIDDTLVVYSGLIVHAPCSTGEFQTTLVDQFPHDLLRSLRLLRPPFCEEGGLHLNEATGGILDQLSDYGIDDVLDTSVLNVAPVTIEVLIDGLQPSDIVVRMGHHVNVDHVCLGFGACLKSIINVEWFSCLLVHSI